MRYLSIFVLLTLTGFAYDCAPKTFTTLTHLLNQPTREEKWSQIFFPQEEKVAPSLERTVEVWNNNNPDFKFVTVYSLPDALASEKFKLSAIKGIPYYWIGIPSNETQLPNSTDLHACIAYFWDNHVTLVTTVDIKEINGKTMFSFFVETITINELIKRTVYIFSIIPDPSTTKALSFIELLSLQFPDPTN